MSFLQLVLEAFSVPLHHLTPNGVCTLSKFVWACYSFGAKPDVDCFCDHYELQYQPKTVVVDGERGRAQFGCCIFIPKRRTAAEESLQISFAQKSRWAPQWARYWFYAKVPELTVRGEDGGDTEVYPLASKISSLEAETRMDTKDTESRWVCEKAFDFACRYSSGRDLVEEFFWQPESGLLVRGLGEI